MQALTVLCLSAFIALSLSQGDGKLPFLKNGGKHWALIVAGSNGYYNYRHQVGFGSYRVHRVNLIVKWLKWSLNSSDNLLIKPLAFYQA